MAISINSRSGSEGDGRNLKKSALRWGREREEESE